MISSIEREYRRYKEYAERTLEQLGPDDLVRALSPGGNSIAVVAWHVSGNLPGRGSACWTTARSTSTRSFP